MTKRVCVDPGCPVLVDAGVRGGRCDTHRRQQDKARGTRQQRGYDAAHDRLRREWAPHVAAGRVRCWRCEEWITASEPWDLGHSDEDRSVTRGPEHTACNRATSGRRQ